MSGDDFSMELIDGRESLGVVVIREQDGQIVSEVKGLCLDKMTAAKVFWPTLQMTSVVRRTGFACRNSKSGSCWPSVRGARRMAEREIGCAEEVVHNGLFEPCGRPAVAERFDPESGGPYPVCSRHVRTRMVPLARVQADAWDQGAGSFNRMRQAERYGALVPSHLIPVNPYREAGR